VKGNFLETDNDQHASLESLRSDTAELLDGYLYGLLKQGGIRVQTTDENGLSKVEMIDLTAAMLNVIRQRVKDLKLGGFAVEGSSTADLIKKADARMKFGGKPIPLPPIDTRRDDAATA
jgi:hypothetical protein